MSDPNDDEHRDLQAPPQHDGPSEHLVEQFGDDQAHHLIYTSQHGAHTRPPEEASASFRRRVGKRKSEAEEPMFKFRRSRTGCLTCRSRRIKCDEALPICERCIKSQRACTYPEEKQTKTRRSYTSRSKVPVAKSASASERDDDDEEEVTEPPKLAAANVPPDESSSRTSVTGIGLRQRSSTPSLTHDVAPTPSTDSGPKPPQSPSQRVDSAGSQPLSATFSQEAEEPLVPSELDQVYLDFFRQHVTCYHYILKFEIDNWLRGQFLDLAHTFEPLFYAVLAFASYLYAVHFQEASLVQFYEYHSKAISSLNKSLPQRSILTILTTLQLATIEECHGNWVGMLDHQQAAHKLFTLEYTSASVMKRDLSRRALSWYVRFDIIVGIMSGSGVFLDRSWYERRHKYYVNLCKRKAPSLYALYMERYSYNGVLVADAAAMWADKARGKLSDADFEAMATNFIEKLDGYEERFGSALVDRSRLIIDFADAPPRDPEDIVDPYEPNFMYGAPLWSTNLMLLDWWAFEFMFKHRFYAMKGQPAPQELRQLRDKMTTMFEAIELYPRRPEGMIISAQGTLGAIGVFLPQDERHSMWLRRKLAAVERSGYMLMNAYRAKMSEHYGTDLSEWWLPDEEAPPILKQVRALVADRQQLPRNDPLKDDLQNMRGVFASLSLSGGDATNKVDKGKQPAVMDELEEDEEDDDASGDEIMG